MWMHKFLRHQFAKICLDVEENQRSLKVEDELKKINKCQLWPYRPAPVAYISKTLVTDLSQPHKA